MADDRRLDSQAGDEFKITVRDRRRVSTEGELREVEEPAAPPPPPPPPAHEPPRPEPKPRAGRRGGALGGAEEARLNRQRLREVPDPEAAAGDAAGEAAGEEWEGPRDVYEYTQVLASQLLIWSLAYLGLMPHPLTQLVTTDMAQATFALDAAEALIDTLVAEDKVDEETQFGLYQSFIYQFGGVAEQLLQQQPQVLLRELGKVRFCIDAADRFAQKMTAAAEVSESADFQAVAGQVKAIVAQLRLAYVQASGGGGIIG